ncbi:MAG: HigA family addiction module antidote protein [Bacteroidales bacterium]|nr:HigA family addiction module antidote protein [Bacteroidales bacterium]
MITMQGVDPNMVANNLKPFLPTHPGEVLKDELEFRGISQRGFAKEIGVSYSVLNEVLNGKRALNTELAMMVAVALDVDAAPLLAMQNEYDMQMAERNVSFMEKLKSIRRVAAVF